MRGTLTTYPPCPNPSHASSSTSSVWIKQHGENYGKFSWQAGYGAFSLGASQLADITGYIDRQDEHHRVKGYKEEVLGFLVKYGIDFDERYLWD